MHNERQSRLYLVEIGGLRDGSLFESHEVHALCAPDEKHLINRCNSDFSDIMQSAHIDGWTSFEVVACAQEDIIPDRRLFVVELGQNAPGYMRERHDYRFITATSGKSAARIVKVEAAGWHIDAIIDLDDLAASQGYKLKRSAPGQPPVADHQSRYLRLKS